MGRTIYVLSGPFMYMHKWSGWTKYDDINVPPDYLCCHKWSLWTIYAQTIYVVTIHSLVVAWLIRIFFLKSSMKFSSQGVFLYNLCTELYPSQSTTLNAVCACRQATPNSCLVSGPVDFQIVMWASGNCHYIIIPFSDEMCKTSMLVHFQLLKRMHMCSIYQYSNYELETCKQCSVSSGPVALINQRSKRCL